MNSTLFGDTDPLIPILNKSPALTFPVNWKETPEAHVFIADLPGLNKEEVKVELEEGRVLKISGEWKVEEEENDKWHCAERCRGDFCRRFRLPENANVEEIKAGMENGVLTITVAKQGIKKPVVKVIEIEEKKVDGVKKFKNKNWCCFSSK